MTKKKQAKLTVDLIELSRNPMIQGMNMKDSGDIDRFVAKHRLFLKITFSASGWCSFGRHLCKCQGQGELNTLRELD